MTPSPCLSSGTSDLDGVLGGDFPSNRFFLVNGEPGAGKTTLVLKFLLEGVRARWQVNGIAHGVLNLEVR